MTAPLSAAARRMRWRLSASRPASVLKGWIGKWIPPPTSEVDQNAPYFDQRTGFFRFQGSNREIGRQFAKVFCFDSALRRSETLLRHDGNAGVRNARQTLERWAPWHLEFLIGIADHRTRHRL